MINIEWFLYWLAYCVWSFITAWLWWFWFFIFEAETVCCFQILLWWSSAHWAIVVVWRWFSYPTFLWCLFCSFKPAYHLILFIHLLWAQCLLNCRLAMVMIGDSVVEHHVFLLKHLLNCLVVIVHHGSKVLYRISFRVHRCFLLNPHRIHGLLWFLPEVLIILTDCDRHIHSIIVLQIRDRRSRSKLIKKPLLMLIIQSLRVWHCNSDLPRLYLITRILIQHLFKPNMLSFTSCYDFGGVPRSFQLYLLQIYMFRFNSCFFALLKWFDAGFCLFHIFSLRLFDNFKNK